MVPGETGKRPLIRLNRVVLPAPLGPMMAWRCAAGDVEVDAEDDRGRAEALVHVA